MSYDLYCYKQNTSSPSLKDASRFLKDLNNSNTRKEIKSPAIKNTIVAGLIKANPRFEKFSLDYDKIAEFENSTIEEAKAKYTYIELNLPECDSAIQITVEDDYVHISIPYWYGDGQSKPVFKELIEYLRIIQNIAGYMVYDPQTSRFFDPVNEEYVDQTVYQRTVQIIPELIASSVRKKPWWKFW